MKNFILNEKGILKKAKDVYFIKKNISDDTDNLENYKKGNINLNENVFELKIIKMYIKKKKNYLFFKKE